MLNDKYQKMLEQFEYYYPNLYEKTVDWWPSGRMTITVRLQDRDEFEFNPMDNSIRRIRVNEFDHDEDARKKAFGANLEKQLIASGLSKGELAERLGITNAMLSRYLRGTSMPSIDKGYLIANVLGCSVEELFDETYIDN